MHPRNRHQDSYDFAALSAVSAELRSLLMARPDGEQGVDFSDPRAVRALNRALLRSQYGIAHWPLASGYLCPPVPGRADYLHTLADLLAAPDGTIPRGPSVRVLDIGVGASAIYPLLGHAEYGWSFVGSEVDAQALASAQAIVDANPGLSEVIELRQQHDRNRIFAGLVRDDEHFELCLCNPPFHASAADAARVNARKWRQLGRVPAQVGARRLNFGGRASELWCRGGEVGFARRMVIESADWSAQVRWFSCLISRAPSIAPLRQELQRVGASEVRVCSMAQGSKQSRFLAWTFRSAEAGVDGRASVLLRNQRT